MSEPIKDNEHIRRDDRTFKEAVKRASEELGRIKGVVGVGYGLKESKGRFTRDIAILIYVLKKEPDDKLPPEERIPETFGGYRTDVRVLLPSSPRGEGCNDDEPYPTIVGGIQIEPHGERSPIETYSAGTLGCIVKKRGDNGEDNVYLLTCYHVLLDTDEESILTESGDGVYHPYFPRTEPAVKKGTLLGKIDTTMALIGHLNENAQLDPSAPSTPPYPRVWEVNTTYTGTYVDCAAVRIDFGSFCCGSACTRNDIQYEPTIPNLNQAEASPPEGLAASDVDRIVDVRDLREEDAVDHIGMRVIKNGYMTARTVGIITAIGPGHTILRYPLDDPLQWRVTKYRYNIIEIALEDPPPATNPCTGTNDFSAGGDSGAIIVDEQNRAVGLLYAGGAPKLEDTDGDGLLDSVDLDIRLTHACHIVPVLDTLGMCIPTTTGTSHGSDKATDGSGLVAYAGESQLPRDEDSVLFSGHGITAAATRTRSPLVKPATEAQRVRMQPLLDALLETERGRKLYDDFSQLSREIAYLVRRNRQVMVAWHRNSGPAFLACVLDHFKGEAETLPREIKGTDRTKLLGSMAKVLHVHGSNPLREALERHGDLPMLLADADTVIECIVLLRRSKERVQA